MPEPNQINPVSDPNQNKAKAQTNQLRQLFNDIADNVGKASYNPFAGAQTYAYDPEGTEDLNKNFRRYYSHPSYDKLGFNPWVDNEAIYNQKSSAWGDVGRAVKAAAHLVPTGFLSPIKSYADIASGDILAPDVESGDAMSYWNKIGSSSRGGALGFTSNLVTNSAYTLGILVETVAELFLTRGLSTPKAITNVANLTKDFGKFSTAVDGITNTVKTLGSNYGMAKTAWEATKAAGKFVNPLENTTNALYNIFKSSDNIGALAKASDTAGAFYRDLQTANLTLSEAKMEGAMAEKDLEEKLVSEYKRDHGGRAPDVQTLTTIKQAAKEAGVHTLGWNIPVIYLTNKFTFEPLLKPINQTAEAALKGTKFALKDGEFVKSTFKSQTIDALKPRNIWKTPLNYFGRNVSEGLQETAQEITSGYWEDYFKNLYEKSDPKKGLEYGLGENINSGDLFYKNVTDQFSGKGFETFASGFLMGGLINTVFSPLKAGSQLYKDYKAERDKYADQTVATLNEMYKDPLRFFGHNILNFAAGSQAVADQNKAEQSGQQKEWIDLEHLNLMSQVTTAIQTGTYDIFLEKLRGVKTMDAQAIKDAYNLDGTEVLSKIDKIIGRADQIKANWEKWNTRYQNPFNPWNYAKDTSEYNKQAVGYRAWEQARNLAVFNESSFQRNTERIQSIVNDILSNPELKAVNPSDVSLLFNPNDVKREIKLLSDEIETMEASDVAETRKEAASKRAKQRKLEKVYSALEGYYVGQTVKELTDDQKKIPQLKAAADSVKNVTKGQLYKAYQDYIGHLAVQHNVIPVNDLALEMSFEKLLDIHQLKMDNIWYADAVDTLANPQKFLDIHKRVNQVMTDLYNRKEDIVNESVKNTQTKIQDNGVLSALFQRGFVLDPNAVEQLIKKKEIPDEFFDTNAKQVVRKGDPRHAEMENIVRNYIEVTKQEEPVKTETKVKPKETKKEEKKEVQNRRNAHRQQRKVEKVDLDLDKRFADVKNGQDLTDLMRELDTIISTVSKESLDVSGITLQDIERRKAEKESELSESVTIDSISVGNVLTMMTPHGDELVTVLSKGKDDRGRWIKVVKPDSNTKIAIYENNLNKSIRNKYAMTAQPVDASAEEVNNIKKSAQTSGKVTDNKELVDELVKEALADPKKAQEEFLEALGCE